MRHINKQNLPPQLPPEPASIKKTHTLPKEDLDRIHRWRSQYSDAAQHLARIEHRDLAGTVVPFTFNYAQLELESDFHRMQALTIKMMADAARSGQTVPIDNLLERLDKGLAIHPYEVPLRVLVGKSRRRGVSAVVQWIIYSRMNFLNNYPAVLMAHNEEAANQIGNYARDFYKRWPMEFRHLRHDDLLNREGKLKLANDSRLDVFTAGSKQSQENSRGWRFDCYHFSEYAHYQSYAEAQACASVAPPHAWIIKESTGNGPSGPFYREWNKALTIDDAERAYEEKNYEVLKEWDGAPLKHEYKIFFSWLDDPGLSAPVMDWERDQYEGNNLDDYEQALLAKFPEKATPNKLKWRRVTIEKDCQNHELPPEAFFAQEWPATPREMFQATGTKVFAAYEVLSLCELEAKPPLFTARVDGVSMPEISPLGAPNLFVYQLPDPERSYVIGLDPKCGAVQNKDEHVITVWDQHDGTFYEEVATLFDARLDGKAVGHIATMLAELYNQAFITPEIQGGGLAVAGTIVGDNGYTRIYERKTLDSIGETGNGNFFRFGVFSSEQMKDNMVQEVKAVMREKRIRIHTIKLIEQFRSFERVDKKYGGPENELDDGVMSTLLGIFGARRQGRPSSRGLRPTELARNKEFIAEALSPELAKYSRMVAAKIALDVRKAARSPNARRAAEPKPPV